MSFPTVQTRLSTSGDDLDARQLPGSCRFHQGTCDGIGVLLANNELTVYLDIGCADPYLSPIAERFSQDWNLSRRARIHL